MSDSTPELRPDTAAALDFLAMWAPEGPWVLTSIVPDGPTNTDTFRTGEGERLARWIDERQGVQNIYFHVNPVRRHLTSKGSKEDVARLAWLHVDLDPREGEEPEAGKARVMKALREFRHAPTVLIDSGGGVQAFWKLDESPKLEINGDIGRAEELEAYNIQLSREFGADHCHNVDRIMRLPGTVNIPNRKKLKKGRQRALAQLIEFDDGRRYGIEQFTAAVQVQRSGDEGNVRLRTSGNIPLIDVEALRDWATANAKVINDHTLALIATGDDPIQPGKYASRSEALMRVCCDLVRAEVPDEMILGVIMGPNEIAASVVEKGRDVLSYAIRQVERAHEQVISPTLAELNSCHSVIKSINGKCRIIREEEDDQLKRMRVVRMTFEDFRNANNNIPVQVGINPKTKEPITVGKGNFWINHPNRRQYDHIIFAPNRVVPNCYNLWRGFAVPALPGEKHRMFLEHVRNNICSGVEEHYRYLLGWMARAVQKPDSPGEVAVVLRGKRGTGKGKFATNFGKLFGRHFLQVANSKHLVGQFNGHLRDTVVLFADEAFFAGDRSHESVLKTLITEESMMVELKGIDAEPTPNFLHAILASNSDWVVPAGLDERRFFVLEVGDSQHQEHSYFAKLEEEMRTGGAENLLHFLLSYDLSGYEVRKVPNTDALREQKALSLSKDEAWLHDKIHNGRWLRNETHWRTTLPKEKLYDDYCQEMVRQNATYRATRHALTKLIQKHCPPDTFRVCQEVMEVPVASDFGGEYLEKRRIQVYKVPDLKTMRDWWDKNNGGPFDWPDWGDQLQSEIPPEESKPPF